MAHVNLHFKEHIAIIELARPKVNAMNGELILELMAAVSDLGEADYIRGAILTGQGPAFSAGLDLFELYDLDEGGINRFWENFHRLIVDMCSFPKPLVAAINGHAPAGGCVLALCCDHRVMAEGKHRIGLNEVPVGLVMPKPVADLTAFTLGSAKASHAILSGTLMEAVEAREFGFVDEHCPPGELLLWAETKLNRWLESFDDAWRYSKRILRAPLLKTMDVSMSEGYGDTITTWWSTEGRAAVTKTLDGLKKR